MNPPPSTHLQRSASFGNGPKRSPSGISTFPFRFGRRFRPALGLILVTVFSFSFAAFSADPAGDPAKVATLAAAEATGDSSGSSETTKADTNDVKHVSARSFFEREMTRSGHTGGVDPHGNSLDSIQRSFQQFGHVIFMLRLFLELVLAVGCAWLIAWHPRRSSRADPLSDLEERKAFIILGLAGAVVAELTAISQTLAFVIFGIGALLRFRTVLDNPKSTGKAIMVVVIGLACGMGSWTMAVFVTAFTWVLLYVLDSHASCSIRVRLGGELDPKPVYETVQSVLLSHHCRIQSFTFSKGKKRLEFLLHMPTDLDPQKLEADVKAKLPKLQDSRISIEFL